MNQRYTIIATVIRIDKAAFNDCVSLKSITIPSSINNFGDYAFSGCIALEDIYVDWTEPSSVAFGTEPFRYINTHNVCLHVPAGSEEKYKNHEIWKNFKINPTTYSYNTSISESFDTSAFSGSGSGTESDPFLIFNPMQLNDVRNFLNCDVYFKLMKDIDLEEWIADNNPLLGWQPIGNASAVFTGHFDGGGHKLTNFFVNRPTTDYVGLFGCVYKADIHDLTIEGTEDVLGKHFVGSLAGYAQESTINSVTSTIKVIGKGDYTGGMIGDAYTCTISSATHSGAVNGESSTGGFTGCANRSTLTSVSQIGDVNGKQFVGGIIGSSLLSTGNTNHFVGDVQASGSYAGGIAGESTTDTIADCTAIGKITGDAIVGGVVGRCVGDFSVSGCGFAGEVISNDNAAGGLVAVVYSSTSDSSISNSYALGDVNATNNYAGGLVGTDDDASTSYTLTDSYHAGDVRGKDYVGGLAGNSKAAISKCYNNGNVHGESNVGGLVGALNTGSISSSVAIVETVSATTANVGRVFGANSGGTIGTMGTSTENKAFVTANVSLNGLKQDCPDGEQHGTSVGNGTLRQRATYTGIGWNFDIWKLLETESFPYKFSQFAPPVVKSDLVSGATVISGNSVDGGMVHISVGGKNYTAVTANNEWSVKVDALQSGDIMTAYAEGDGLVQSYIVNQRVGYAGKGTKSDPYRIYTAGDLANATSYSYFKIMNDIDLTDYIAAKYPTTGWQPIGLNGGGTMRQLDGDGHKVTGLWTNTTLDYCGLISSTSNATICNLQVVVASGKQVKGGSNTGIVVGKSSNTIFSDITVSGIAKGDNYVGGIAGSALDGSFTDCAISGTIGGKDYVGGLAGDITGSIADCTANTTITGTNYIGALAGKMSGTVERCFANATVSGSEYVGGLFGHVGGTVTRSRASASVTGSHLVGGIAGYNEAAISECYSIGSVNGTGTSQCYAGGIAGESHGDITDCYSTATIQAGVEGGNDSELQQFGGGIVGVNFATIARCYASGNINAVRYGAGIVARNDASAAVTTRCYAVNSRINVSNKSGQALRVVGNLINAAPYPAEDNYALKTMVLSINGVTQKIYDDILHGIALEADKLTTGTTYTANGWDLTNVWTINEGSGLPYLRNVEVAADQGTMTTSLEIDAALTLFEGDTHLMTAVIAPEEASRLLVWSSSDEAVATVDNEGLVTAIAPGTATITATTTDGSYLSATCAVTVNKRIITTDNVLTASDMSATTGDQFNVNVGLTNQASITAVQCDVYLPAGLQFVTEDDEYVVDLIADRVSRNHSVSTSDLTDGGVRVLIASQTSKPVIGNEGDLFTMSLIAPDGTASGEYVVDIRNIILSDVSSNVFYAPDVNVNVMVSDFTPGDVNGDKTINVGDYVTTANYILLKNPQPFIFAAADLDRNDQINVGDLVGVANLALHYEAKSAKRGLPSNVPHVVSLGATATSMRSIAVTTTGAAALQLDVTLPAGMTLASASVAGHSADVARMANGSYRVLVASPAAQPISGEVTLTIDGNAEGNALLHGILVADPTGAVTAFDDIVLPIGTTGLSDIAVDGNEDDTLYDLQGRRVVNPAPGIYIKAGKKILVK